ncbi:MAG: CRISPR-associated endonuclease Cas2 [Lachnospiraceae bacterium]|nr:CRISPR-associated endonuclease Cas2 [Lachnospiraceae bacterium]
MYVISYDVEKDKIRNKIAKTLEDYGSRVQYSVFECRINQKQCDKLYAKLAKLMADEEEGNIRIYTVCANCEAKLATIGIKKKAMITGEEDLFII